MSGPTVPLPPALAEEDDDNDLHKYLLILRRYWLLVAGLLVAGAVFGYVRYSVKPRLYRAETIIQIERRSLAAQLGSDATTAVESRDDEQFYPTQYRLLQSHSLAERVVKRLRWQEDPRFGSAAATAGLAQGLLRNLGISPLRDTQLVAISYRSSDPEIAARVANGFAEAYIDWTLETRQTATSRAAEFLAREIDELKAAIRDKDRQIKEFSREASLNETLNEAMRKRIEADSRYRELARADPGAVTEISALPTVAELKQERARLEREYEAKLETFKPSWPAMVELKAEIDKERTYLTEVQAEELDKLRRKALGEYQAAVREEADLQAEIDGLPGTALASSEQAVELANLQRELGLRQTRLEGILQRQSDTQVESRLQEQGYTANVRIVDRALVPTRPVEPNLRRSVATGGGGGLALGVGLAFLLGFLDRTVKDSEEVERLTGLPTLGVIPDVSKDRSYGPRYGYGRRRK